MVGIYGVNLTGLKRRPTFEEIIGTENFKLKYPDRSYKFLKNSPIMTQFNNIGAFELEEYYNREMVQRQMHGSISSIAKSSDLTDNEVKAISKGIGKLTPKFQMSDPIDMEGAKDELKEQVHDEEEHRLLNIQQGKRALQDDRTQSSRENFVEQFVIGSDDDQLGASSGPKPEDTGYSVEEAKEVFSKGRTNKK